MPKVACPSCQRSLTIKAEHVGKNIKCPKCRTMFQVFLPPTQADIPGDQSADKDDGIPIWAWIASGFVLGLLVLVGIVVVAALAVVDSEVREFVVVGVPCAMLLIVVIILHNVTAPIYQITLKQDDTCAVKDNGVRVTFDFDGPVNLRSLKAIEVDIDNSSNEPVRVDWDASTFVDPDGQSCRVIHAGVRLIRRDAAQVPSTIASSSHLSEILVPADNITWKPDGNWQYSHLFLPWAKRKRFSFRLLLTMKVRGLKKDYEFRFSAVKIDGELVRMVRLLIDRMNRLIDH